MMPTASELLRRVDGRDRALFLRLASGTRDRKRVRLTWTFITHLGGATSSVVAALAPLFIRELSAAGSRPLLILILSHAAVQMVKRTIGRPRPSLGVGDFTSIVEPDRFSFPSGHAAAAMAVAIGYALAFPPLALPLVAIATVVGISRVCLGVHYPGDVVMGQSLAIVTAIALATLT